MTYSWKRFHDHYVVIDLEGNVVCHCDTPEECREEIEIFKAA